MRPRLLDLYSCAGGAAMGYHRAGFDVVGVDISPQPRYPFEHHVGDALEYLAAHGAEFDVIHASPPCQRYSVTAKIAATADNHPDLLEPTRDALLNLGKPYVIENVVGAPMRDYVTLCGSEFGLTAADPTLGTIQLRRHRQFESNIYLLGAGGCQHVKGMPVGSVFGSGGTWTSRRITGGGYVPSSAVCAELLGIDWMKKREMSESIPPAYTEYIGAQLLEAIA